MKPFFDCRNNILLARVTIIWNNSESNWKVAKQVGTQGASMHESAINFVKGYKILVSSHVSSVTLILNIICTNSIYCWQLQALCSQRSIYCPFYCWFLKQDCWFLKQDWMLQVSFTVTSEKRAGGKMPRQFLQSQMWRSLAISKKITTNNKNQFSKSQIIN